MRSQVQLSLTVSTVMLTTDLLCSGKFCVHVTTGNITTCDAVIEAAVASSVTVFILSSVFFFVIGYVCGWFCQKRKQSVSKTSLVTPVYEDVLTKTVEHDLELKKNVAYGPI